MRNEEEGREDERNDALGERRTLLQVAEKSVYKEAKLSPG